MSGAYYNELDPYAAQWLRNLIAAGHIAPGDVDERDIRLVRPDELRGYTQCHFFAGIGIWSYALRLAGWEDERPVWTGSCPCQPFSDAGKGEGFDDERHLWPDWAALIGECRPRVVLGEQVASKDGLAWLDLVHADLEAAGYTVGALDSCAAGVGAPHIRQRFFFVADADEGRGGRHAGAVPRTEGEAQRRVRGVAHGAESGGAALGMADAGEAGRGRLAAPRLHGRRDTTRSGGAAAGDLDRARGNDAARRSALGGMADADVGSGQRGFPQSGERSIPPVDGEVRAGVRMAERLGDADGGRRADEDAFATGRESIGVGPGATNGFWRDAVWIPCRDGKARPIEPGSFPLAHGAPARVGRLRAYGNAINAEAAREFIRAYIDVRAAA